MNKNLFKTQKAAPKNFTKNNAGGNAYSFTDEHALAQLAVTGCFNGTFYASGEDQLKAFEEKAKNCSSEFIAKLAVYAHEESLMKDAPAYLCAVLHSLGDIEILSKVFMRVMTNFKMVSNFVRIVRSGALGRKSFGTLTKNMLRLWITSKTSLELFRSSVGISDPSLKDVILMVHPRAGDEEQNNMFRYVLGLPYEVNQLPVEVANFEKFKVGESNEVPRVDFRQLSNLTLNTEQWKQIGRNMSWTQVRMNLNTLARHKVFEDKVFAKEIADKLSDAKRIQGFPYQLFNTYLNVSDVPNVVKNALQDALEISVTKVPKLDSVALCIDTSGSMSSAITGNRGSATSSVRCIDVAALIACSIARQNEDTLIVPFDTRVHQFNFNSRDSVVTNSDKLRKFGGGGTDCGCALAHLNNIKSDKEVVIYVSDNESWAGMVNPYRTGMDAEWKKYKSRVPNAKLVLIDIQPYTTTQVQDSKDVLNVCGWNDTVYTIVERFLNKDTKNFVQVIDEYFSL